MSVPGDSVQALERVFQDQLGGADGAAAGRGERGGRGARPGPRPARRRDPRPRSRPRPPRPRARLRPGPAGGRPSDPGLAGFVNGGVWDSRPPSAALAAALEGAAGAGWRCEGGSYEEIVGAVRAAAALESWWCAAKLGLIRAAIRQDDPRLPDGEYHGDLPDAWSRSLTDGRRAGPGDEPGVGREADSDRVGPGGAAAGHRRPAGGRHADLSQGAGGQRRPRAAQRAGQGQGGGDDRGPPRREDVRAGREDRGPGRDHRRPGAGGAEQGARRAEPGAGHPEAGTVRRGEPVRLRAAAGRDAGRARRRLRPGAGVQGVWGVPGRADGPVPGDGLSRPDERDQRRGQDRAGPAGRGPGRPGRGRVPRRAGAGRPGRARAGGQRRVRLPLPRVRRQMPARC